MELKVQLLWEYIDRVSKPVLVSWLRRNNAEDGYANDQIFFDEVSLKAFETIIGMTKNGEYKTLYNQLMCFDIDDKKGLEKQLGSQIRQQIVWSAIDLLDDKKGGRGIINKRTGFGEEETIRNQRRNELMAIKDRPLTTAEKDELYNLRKYDQFFFGYERESDANGDDTDSNKLTGNLKFGVDVKDDKSDIYAEHGMVAKSFYQPERSSERLEVLEFVYELIEECFDNNYSSIKDAVKKEFIHMVFWDVSLVNNFLKDLAKGIGFNHSNPTQVFQRFLDSVNECLTKNNPLDFELALKETSKEVDVIMKEIEVLQVTR